ncbi:WD40 repeat-like protein [Aspergillus sclerotioniger CBS 115572]|uniref:WD40 repeat-like protein n=1 Tax=Aspergillus sclerotioniger CBS 115572 TaxID=1450535 RepID=A0A317WDR1_9EURO|nr:WD40 repeat-like protein [Aspergillus sclerotioniger CBS 115572]PWY83871.1 WD40 repeat-like protein [Aspergillus sclerotioniger CBS 115572]
MNTSADDLSNPKEQAEDGFQSTNPWQAAFDRLSDEDQRVLMPERSTDATGEDHQASSVMTGALNEVINTVKTQHEIRMLKNDNSLQVGARRIINPALAAQESVSALVACDPTGHASSAWTVISVGLKITQNYRDRQNGWFQSAAFLSETLARMTLTEARYFKDAHSETKEVMINALIETYVEILHYSAEILDTITNMTSIPLETIESSVRSKYAILKEWIDIEKDLNHDDKIDSILAGINDVLAAVQNMQTSSYLRDLPTAANASYDSYSGEPESQCLSGTRVDLLQTIEDWADNPNGRPLFWLNGMAGTGKSTISRTVSKIMNKRGLLGASFFFKRGETDRGNSAMLCPTLLHQLVRVLPQLNAGLGDAVKSARATIPIQFEELLFKPLANVNMSNGQRFPLIVVIDALDECVDLKNIQFLLQLLPRLRGRGSSVELRFFLTSRPEIAINLGFKNEEVSDQHQDAILHDIKESVVRNDIAIFFNHNLPTIRNERGLEKNWPGEENIQKLIGLAVPLFIFAATICRLFQDSCWHPIDSLNKILEHREEESRLVTTYATVVEGLLQNQDVNKQAQLVGETQEVVGAIVILEDPLAVLPLSDLIRQPKTTVQVRVESLPSVLKVPSRPDQPVKLFHKSFRDFILDPKTRDKNRFWVDETEMNKRMAYNCIRVMERKKRGLRKNICGLKSYEILREEIDDGVVQKQFPAELQYACRHWVRHLEQGKVALTGHDTVHQFLQQHFLHWLEAMAILGFLPQLLGSIDRLQSLVKSQNESEITTFLYDAKRFLLANIRIAEQAPLQLYSSALVFAPNRSIIRRTFEKDRISCISQLPSVESDWGATLQTIEDPDGSDFAALAVSPDDRVIATGSSGGNVHLWRQVSGPVSLQQTLRHCDYSEISCVAFSPNGKLLASASDDGLIRLWNISSGLALLQSELNTVNNEHRSLAFSPDSDILALARTSDEVQLLDLDGFTIRETFEGTAPFAFSSGNMFLLTDRDQRTMRVLNVKSGTIQSNLIGHSGKVESAAFSPDGSLLVSRDRSDIKLWDVETGRQEKNFPERIHAPRNVEFSANGRFIGSISENGTIKLRDIASGDTMVTLEGHSTLEGESDIEYLALFSDSKMLVSADSTYMKLWDLSSRVNHHEGRPIPTDIEYLLLSAGKGTIASQSYDGICLWDIEMGKPCLLPDVNEWDGDGRYSGTMSFSPDGSMLSSGSSTGIIRLWDLPPRRIMSSFHGHEDRIHCTAISFDLKSMASGSSDGTVRLWDIKSVRCIHVLQNSSGEDPESVAFSQSNRLLVAGYSDGTVRIWETASGTLQKAFRYDNDTDLGTLMHVIDDNIITTHLSFSEDGSYLATNEKGFHINIDERNGAITSSPCMKVKHNEEWDWIQWEGQDVLWLPPEYRPASRLCKVMWDNAFAMGTDSGSVLIFRFNGSPDDDLHPVCD